MNKIHRHDRESYRMRMLYFEEYKITIEEFLEILKSYNLENKDDIDDLNYLQTELLSRYSKEWKP